MTNGLIKEESKTAMEPNRAKMTAIEDRERGILFDSNQMTSGLTATAMRKATYTKSRILLISLKNLVPRKTARTQKMLEGAISMVWRSGLLVDFMIVVLI